jgi:hypothetical protein
MSYSAQFYIKDRSICGPVESGKFWLDDKGYICGPQNNGRFYIRDNWVWDLYQLGSAGNWYVAKDFFHCMPAAGNGLPPWLT